VTSRPTAAGEVAQASADEAAHQSCHACGASGLVAFYEVGGVPAQTCVLLDGAHEAETYPRGDILLAYCGSCGFIQNVRFDLELVDYSKPTEESQAFSPRFTEFASRLADDLVHQHGLDEKTVLEVGCGKGDFLELLAERGIALGLGIDPGYLPNRDEADRSRVEYRRDWYGAGDTHLTGDLVLSRHLMEHVPNVGEFFGWLVESAMQTPGSVMFTEVPDTTRVLAEGAFWDVYHEHCSYFTLGSLARALRCAGMTVTDLRYGFDDQYLLAQSVPGAGGEVFVIEDTPDLIAELAEHFAKVTADRVAHWRSAIADVQSGGGAVAVWGGGSKAAAFLTSVDADDVTVVDINPHKQGKWLPGSAVEVRSPEVLLEVRPDLVIPMNPIYLDEISRDLDSMGLAPRVEAL
jgi:SAM-dependent methyltransferase